MEKIGILHFYWWCFSLGYRLGLAYVEGRDIMKPLLANYINGHYVGGFKYTKVLPALITLDASKWVFK